jgi:hypothetical protein
MSKSNDFIKLIGESYADIAGMFKSNKSPVELARGLFWNLTSGGGAEQSYIDDILTPGKRLARKYGIKNLRQAWKEVVDDGEVRKEGDKWIWVNK